MSLYTTSNNIQSNLLLFLVLLRVARFKSAGLYIVALIAENALRALQCHVARETNVLVSPTRFTLCCAVSLAYGRRK